MAAIVNQLRMASTASLRSHDLSAGVPHELLAIDPLREAQNNKQAPNWPRELVHDLRRTDMSDFSRKADESASRLNEKINSAAQRLEKEGAELIEYLNKEVVPAVRQQSSKALRVAAERLQRLAAFMEEHKSTGEEKKP